MEIRFLLGTLAAAYAEAGRFPEAVKTAQHALQMAVTQTNTARRGGPSLTVEALSGRQPVP